MRAAHERVEGKAMGAKSFQDCPPDKPHLTGYDEAHLNDYLRLLDAETAGADWRAVVYSIFNIDAASEPDRAKIVHRSHLARAHWMTEIGYAYLIGERLN